MTWMTRKLDSLFGAVAAASGGMVLSQASPFAGQYLHRLSFLIAEARASLTEAMEVAGGVLPDPLAQALTDRLASLESAYQTLSACGPWVRPLVLAWEADRVLLRATFDHFLPALPLAGPALLHTLAGLIVGLMVYEGCKAPFALFRAPSRRRRRLFEGRGGR